MKRRTKILSALLSFVLILTSLFPITIVANAGSSGGGGSAGGGINTDWGQNDNRGVLKVTLSSITDDSAISNLGSINYRFGDGTSTAAFNYPLFMRNKIYSDFSPDLSHDTTYDDNYIKRMKDEFSNWRPSNVEEKMSNKVNRITGKNSTFGNGGARDLQTEFFDGKVYEYWADTDFFNSPATSSSISKPDNFAGVGVNTNGYNGADYAGSIYLEDAIGRVLKLNKNGKLTDADVKAFWYFYTFVANGANNMRDNWDHSYNESNNVGAALQESFLHVIKDDTGADNSVLFRHGYTVALYAVYGQKCLDTLKLGGSSTNREWADWGSYKSIVVTRLQAEVLHSSINFGGNKITYSAILMSCSGVLSLAKEYTGIYDQSQIPGLSAFQDINVMHESNTSLGWYNSYSYTHYVCHFAQHIFDSIRPAYTRDYLTHNSGELRSSLYGGWGYYDFTSGVLDIDDYVDEDVYYIGSQRTANAYMVSESEYEASKHGGLDSRGMETSSNAFGDTGHVMSDTYFLASPEKFEKYKELKDDVEIKNKKDVTKYHVTFDKEITLDAPFEGTKYTLAKLTYFTTNAGGYGSIFYPDTNEENDFISNEVHRNTVCANAFVPSSTKELQNYIDISNKYVYNVLTDPENKYKLKVVQRNKSPKINYSGIQVGKYQDKDGSTQLFYVYKYDDVAKDYVKDIINGKNYTTEIEDRKVQGQSEIGTYDKTDTDEKSTNVRYLWFNEKYYPIVFENGNWYFVTLNSRTSILLNFIADYVATYSPDTQRNNKTAFKTKPIDTFLLSKNYDTSEFSRERLYTMIDDYVTGSNGALENKAGFEMNDGFEPIEIATDNSGLSLMNPYGSTLYLNYADNSISVFGHNSSLVTSDPTDLWRQNDVCNTSGVNGARQKTWYITQLSKTSPVFTYNAPSDISNTQNNTFVDAHLYVKTLAYNANSELIEEYDSRGNVVTKTTPQYYLGSTTNTVGSQNKITELLKNDGYMYGESTPHVGGITSYYSYDAHRVSFGKVLASYKKNIYKLKVDLKNDSVPQYADWVNGNNVSNGSQLGLRAQSGSANLSLKDASVVNGGFVRFGETTILNEHGNYINKDGNETGDYNKWGLRHLVNNSNLPYGIVAVSFFDSNSEVHYNQSNYQHTNLLESYTQSAYDVPLKYTVNVFNPNKTSPRFINSSMSIINNKKINSTYQYNNVTTPSGSGLYKTSGNSVSLGIFPEVLMWSESDLTKNNTLTYSSVVTAGTKKRYIPAMTYAQLDLNNMLMTAKVTGTAIAYDTRAKALATRLGSTIPPVLYSGSGLKMAFEAKSGGSAKVYALDISDIARGSRNRNLKSDWGNSQYSASDAAAKAVNNILSNIEGSMDKKLSIYNGSSLKEISMGSDNNVKLSAGTPERINRCYDLKIHAGKIVSVDCKEIGPGNVFKTINTYVLTYPSNNSTDVSILCTPNAGSQESRDKAAKLGELLKGLKLLGSDSILPACFENNTGDALFEGNENLSEREVAFDKWIKAHNSSYENRYSLGGHSYFEDTSVLTIKEFNVKVNVSGNTTATEQLPLTLGPKTPTNKNEYFTNGYKGFVVGTLTLKGKTGTPLSTFSKSVVSKHTKMNTAESIQITNSTAKDAIPDFIIADVTINEATAY